jgi:hypothetical protein
MSAKLFCNIGNNTLSQSLGIELCPGSSTIGLETVCDQNFSIAEVTSSSGQLTFLVHLASQMTEFPVQVSNIVPILAKILPPFLPLFRHIDLFDFALVHF